jgi:hypothetical protein
MQMKFRRTGSHAGGTVAGNLLDAGWQAWMIIEGACAIDTGLDDHLVSP